MDPEVRLATESDLESAAHVLAEAFDAYAWTRWALPAEDYRGRLREVQRLYLGHALEHGIVVVDERVRAVAAFLPPEAPVLAEHVQHRVAELHGSRVSALAELDLPGPPTGAWTLETVGVDPASQGSGLGTAVTSAGLSMLDDHGAPVALETSDERNVRLYERLGFTTVATTDVADGPTVFSMSRAARRSPAGRWLSTSRTVE